MLYYIFVTNSLYSVRVRREKNERINPKCPANDGIEDTGHFLLFCPSREVPRRDLLAGVSALLPPLGNTDLSNEFQMQISSYGDKDFPYSLNKGIVLLTLLFIHATGRFY